MSEDKTPTCYRCSEAKTLRQTAQTIGRMEGTLDAILAQATKTNGSIENLYERSNSHGARLGIHNGRIKTLEDDQAVQRGDARDWRKFATGVFKGVLLLLAATGIAYLTKAFN